MEHLLSGLFYGFSSENERIAVEFIDKLIEELFEEIKMVDTEMDQAILVIKRTCVWRDTVGKVVQSIERHKCVDAALKLSCKSSYSVTKKVLHSSVELLQTIMLKRKKLIASLENYIKIKKQLV